MNLANMTTAEIIDIGYKILTLAILYLAHRNIRKVEVATNSMKDALVKSTGELAHVEGVAMGRREAFAETGEQGAAKNKETVSSEPLPKGAVGALKDVKRSADRAVQQITEAGESTDEAKRSASEAVTSLDKATKE